MPDSKLNEDLSPWLEGIKGEPVRKLILSDSPRIQVVAEPGSGKTTGLKRRVRRLVKGDHLSVDRIYVGTFTRAIASELRTELGTEVKVSTLHALANKLLRNNPASPGGLKLRFLLKHEEGVMPYNINVPNLNNQGERVQALQRQRSARAERLEPPDAAFAGIDGLAKFINQRANEKFLVLVPLRLIGHRLKDLIGEDARTGFHQEVLEHRLVQQQFTAASVLANLSDRVAIRT